jgi:hypothetical protein
MLHNYSKANDLRIMVINRAIQVVIYTFFKLFGSESYRKKLIRSCAVAIRSNSYSYNSEKKMSGSGISRMAKKLQLPQHFLYFFPLPHGQGAFLPTFCSFSFFG